MGRLGLKSTANITKMYWESKKKVYGIENELHLVE
jgi:16S rRNA A1518/A1519 N6-dimethyltransferase RsmA/KsgA/DIM1 with predicted DNA glycosylase/AP lyase activity